MEPMIFNELPRPTFRWLRVNHTNGEVLGASVQTKTIAITGNASIIEPLANNAPLLKADYEGANKNEVDYIVANCEAYAITVPENGEEALTITVDGTDRVAARLQYHVKENASLTVLLMVDGKSANPTNVQLLQEFDVATGAKVVFKKVNLLYSTMQHIEHRYTLLGEDADVEYINLEIGAGENILNYYHDLQGQSSNIVHDIAYLGNDTQKFDISMLMSHIGKKTTSDIHTLGALRDTSKKTFRGTLDFVKGSTAAEGAEEDTCLLLDPTVKSISLPLLLCKEDNVVGNHAASAGQLDQGKLFYLMSRGFSEDESKRMIVESMIRPVIDRIGDEMVEEAVLTAVRNKI